MNTLLSEPVVSESVRAQCRWAATPLRQRLQIVRELRHQIAEEAGILAQAAAAVSNRPVAEKLVSEVLPLAEACRWLEKNAALVLAPRRHGKRGRPLWLGGSTFEVQRQPVGTVLVIGPGNYPLFLPAIHALQALVAGNAVLLKPAPGTRAVANRFAQLTRAAGIDPALLSILPESVEAAHDAISSGVDKVIFTGSSENGREVLAVLAETNTPSVMELSGEDAVVVLADADLDLVVQAVRFGTQLNDGETCIAPRRLFVVNSVADSLSDRLGGLLPITRVADEAAAVEQVNAADYALGAAIFSRDIARAKMLAAQMKTGFVLINDMIVPTADPRMPFGGVKASGFGSTRGDEGLLEMTFPHVVAIRAGGLRPHFEASAPDDARLFRSYIQMAHGRHPLRAVGEFFGAMQQKIKTRKPNS